jgi:alkanesulfonate monooxygenase SsuD/methylene tetrahydromethanopterin reductase-like flavin-dependent oxidoreductase (luciferase family)
VTPEVGVRLPIGVDSGELLAEAGALEAAGAHLLWAGDRELDPITLLAAVAALTSRIRLALEEPAAGRERELETLRVLSRGRLVVGLPEGWVEVAAPEGRAAWRELRARHAAAGTVGILLAYDPRLVDLLRNPDQEDDRSQDLQLAQG